MDPYATHLPYLVKAVLLSGVYYPGSPIVELGCGDYSTPLLAQISAVTRRPFIVYASNEEWLSKYNVNSRVVKWEGFTCQGGVVFLDNEQKVRDRIKLIPNLHAPYIVLHDACKVVKTDEWGTLTSGFEVDICTDYKPWTAILKRTGRTTEN